MSRDPVAAIGATTRSVEKRIHDGVAVHAVIAGRTYPTDAADLWDAITNAERIPRWFLPVSGELRLGGRYQFEGNAGGTVTACEPPRRLAATWEFAGQVSWVTVTLSADGAATQLTLEHLVPDDDHWRRFGPGAVGLGWDSGFMGLGNYLAGGIGVTPATAAAWLATPAATAFFRNSCVGWLAADLAGGEAAVPARQRADQTLAAYTGGTAHL
ncbi:MAG TPA: SRPBCC family protein [Devosiaceae bacterium]|jgi:uncharacterized protein YndB with AHSA1/START domain